MIELVVVKIAQFDDGKGFTIQEAIFEAKKGKLRLLSNTELDSRLVGSDEWKSEKEMYPCWSGTFIGYGELGKPLGEKIESDGFIVIVPKKFQKKIDVALVCNHPDFILKENIFYLGKSAKAIPFPKSVGWYLPEKDFGIPNGENDESKNTRYLWRRNGAYVGLVSRWYVGFDGDDFHRLVGCDGYYGGARLGVFGDNSKFIIPKHKHEWHEVCSTCGE